MLAYIGGMTGPTSKSERTRAAILAAARQRFAAAGYEKTTVRAIAGDASIDPAMVMRYFGSKELLFTAAIQIDLRMPDLATLPREQLGTALVAHFLELWEGNETLQVLLRAGVTNEEAAATMQRIFREQLLPVVAPLSADAGEAARRAGLAASQILGLALCRYILRFPQLVAMSKADVVASVAPTIQAYLTGKVA